MVLVACGWRHTISVSSSGGLYTYGRSKYGQLGHGDFEVHLIPHTLEALHENFISQFGQVGVGDNVHHCSPAQVELSFSCTAYYMVPNVSSVAYSLGSSFDIVGRQVDFFYSTI
ncbi:hypothetical protein CsSME_00040243 [Camellia sinensis var. sinensis]